MKKTVQIAARGVCKVGDLIHRNGRKFLVVGFTAAGSAICSAQTDLSSTITAVGGYWTSVEVIAIGVLLFVVGRRIVKKV